MICLDGRLPDVDVPREHKSNPSLNLVLNLNFRRPLDVLPEAVYVTLAFQGRPHACVIPFDAVWAIFEPALKKGQVWEESIPSDINLEEHLQGQISKDRASPEKQADTDNPAPPRGEMKPGKKLPKVLTGSKKMDSAPTPPTKRDRSHLRVIK